MGMLFVGRRLSGDELRAVREDAAVVPSLFIEAPELDLDKAWHGIHFLLTGSAWEVGEGAGAAILGGEPIGPEVGQGPARLLGPELVRAVADGLAAIDAGTLRERFDPAAMAEIYPSVWDEDFDTYLAPYFAALREFYRLAAAEGQAVLVAVT